MRLTPLSCLFFVTACGGDAIYSPASATPRQEIGLFRGAPGEEVKLRCGSEELKARIRAGKLVVVVGKGEPSQLEPVNEPRAAAGSAAYGNTKLTFYRVAPETWELRKVDDNSTSKCERPVP